MAVYRGLEITGSTSQGIYHAAPTLGIRIEDCHIHNNQGGVYIRPAVERIEIINNEIHDNAGYGGIYVFSPEETLPIRITDNHIYNTTSSTGTVGCVSLAGRWVTCFCSHSMQTQAL